MQPGAVERLQLVRRDDVAQHVEILALQLGIGTKRRNQRQPVERLALRAQHVAPRPKVIIGIMRIQVMEIGANRVGKHLETFDFMRLA